MRKLKTHATVSDALESAFLPPKQQAPRRNKDGTIDRRGLYQHKPAPANHPWNKPYNFGKRSPDYIPR